MLLKFRDSKCQTPYTNLISDLQILPKKSRIWETMNLSTDTDSSTDAKKLLSIFFSPPRRRRPRRCRRRRRRRLCQGAFVTIFFWG